MKKSPAESCMPRRMRGEEESHIVAIITYDAKIKKNHRHLGENKGLFC